MANKQRDPAELFSPVKDSPMQFTMILDKMLQIEWNRVLKCIDDHGGEFCGFDYDDKYINLASAKYTPQPHETIFNVKYIKKCANANKLYDLKNFQLSGKKSTQDPRCIPLEKIFESEKCPHRLSQDEVLAIMENTLGITFPDA